MNSKLGSPGDASDDLNLNRGSTVFSFVLESDNILVPGGQMFCTRPNRAAVHHHVTKGAAPGGAGFHIRIRSQLESVTLGREDKIRKVDLLANETKRIFFVRVPVPAEE